MKRRLIYSPEAQQTLKEIRDYISEHSSARIASSYIADLRVYCDTLRVFAEVGTLRSDVRPHLRVVGFRDRVSIHFAVHEDSVLLLRFTYAGRDWVWDYRSPQ